MTEPEPAVWLKAMTACAQVNSPMQVFNSVGFSTNEQYKDKTRARIQRDCSDTQTLVSFLYEINLFDQSNSTLRNIESGVTADDSVNVDTAHAIGKNIVNEMAGKDVMSYSFKRKDQVVPMTTASCVKSNDEDFHVDPQLLFQRLTSVTNGIDEDISDVFRVELWTHTSSLFDEGTSKVRIG